MSQDTNEVSQKAMEELQAIAEDLEPSYWVPLLKTPFSGLDKIEAESKEDCPVLHECLKAFRSNLEAARELLEFPYLLLTPILVPLFPDIPISSKQLKELEARFEQPMDKAEMIAWVTAALKTSGPHIKRQHPTLQRIMHQACLLIWSAVEIYCKQVFIASLNEKPSLLTTIYDSQKLKERFNIQNNSWLSLLDAHDFNLHGKLGTIVAANRDFSSPQLLQDLFPYLYAKISSLGFPETVFQSDSLWKLGQRRHLIAHHCGVVDQEYLDKTNDTNQKLGQILTLRGRDIAESMGAAASFAILLYGNARYCWPGAEEETK